MVNLPLRHDEIRIQRTFPVSPETLFNAFADPSIKAQWENPLANWAMPYDNRDFRIGGRETSHCGPPGENLYHFEVVYLDIVRPGRIVHASSATGPDGPISASLTSIEIDGGAGGSILIHTEQIVFLDEAGTEGEHRHGMELVYDNLAAWFDNQ
jgi:uncharacterized protein YndB with AHSA1/START domain